MLSLLLKTVLIKWFNSLYCMLLSKECTKMQFFSHVKNNWKSGFTILLVSIPLSISDAIAAKYPPFLKRLVPRRV